jgi:peptidoglycan/LPS O-acetylase OafA/YrhL
VPISIRATIIFAVLAGMLAATLCASALARWAFPLPSSAKRLGCIDGLRGYVALAVLGHHFTLWMQLTRFGLGWTDPQAHFLKQLGTGAVGLFFMVTGLVFYPRVLAGFRDTHWVGVLITRVFRIVPMVAIVLLVATVIVVARTGASLDSRYPFSAFQWLTTWDQPALLGYANSGRINASVLWSLRFEWLFYLLVLPACAVLRDLTRGRYSSWIVPVMLLILCMPFRLANLPVPVLPYLPLFAIGMLAFEVQQREHLASRLRGGRVGVAASASLLIGMVIAPSPTTYAIPFFAFFFICVACGNSLGGILRTQAALVLGECSYSIYLLHGVVLSLLFVDLAPETAAIPSFALPALIPVAAVAITLVAAFTYRSIERPSISLGVRIARMAKSMRSSEVSSATVAP